MQTIKIYSEAFPAYQTMGAMRAYKQNSGKDVAFIASGGVDEMIAYLYFVVRSACRREDKPFPYDNIDDFADGISFDDFSAWSLSLAADLQESKTEASGEATGK